MVPRVFIRSTRSVALTLLLGAIPAFAGPINFTGNVANDFPQVPGNGVVIYNNPMGPVALDPTLVAKGFVSGWGVKDIRFSYDKATDQLSVGFNTYGIAGDADGNGNPGTADPFTASKFGNDLPNFGGHKSITLALAADSPSDSTKSGTPVIVAGIPSDKPAGVSGIADFQVARYLDQGRGLANSYGTKLLTSTGTLAFNPDAAHPGFEFFISNFSKIPGLDPTKGIWVSAFAGADDDRVAGETNISGFRIPKLADQNIPEPASVLAWGTVVAGAAIYARRRKQNATL